ncbi:MAG: hypothetical protein M1820_008416, partial [Bogoriella megaspora]
LHDAPQRIWQKELFYAKCCIDVLEHCGSVDVVAKQFAETTRKYYDTLNARNKVADPGNDISSVEMPDDCFHLFVAPSDTTTHHHQMSQELLELFSRPFGHKSNLHIEGTLKAGFGTQLDWNNFVTMVFNKTHSDAASDVPLPHGYFPNVYLDGLRESSNPHGWGTITNQNGT